ncbi:hypothetical protein GGF32_005286 [Allomyces javanicus]|nr:hypothetical protein GGF32_005286 [Allomyces javanicus]
MGELAPPVTSSPGSTTVGGSAVPSASSVAGASGGAAGGTSRGGASAANSPAMPSPTPTTTTTQGTPAPIGECPVVPTDAAMPYRPIGDLMGVWQPHIQSVCTKDDGCDKAPAELTDLSLAGCLVIGNTETGTPLRLLCSDDSVAGARVFRSLSRYRDQVGQVDWYGNVSVAVAEAPDKIVRFNGLCTFPAGADNPKLASAKCPAKLAPAHAVKGGVSVTGSSGVATLHGCLAQNTSGASAQCQWLDLASSLVPVPLDLRAADVKGVLSCHPDANVRDLAALASMVRDPSPAATSMGSPADAPVPGRSGNHAQEGSSGGNMPAYIGIGVGIGIVLFIINRRRRRSDAARLATPQPEPPRAMAAGTTSSQVLLDYSAVAAPAASAPVFAVAPSAPVSAAPPLSNPAVPVAAPSQAPAAPPAPAPVAFSVTPVAVQLSPHVKLFPLAAMAGLKAAIGDGKAAAAPTPAPGEPAVPTTSVAAANLLADDSLQDIADAWSSAFSHFERAASMQVPPPGRSTIDRDPSAVTAFRSRRAQAMAQATDRLLAQLADGSPMTDGDSEAVMAKLLARLVAIKPKAALVVPTSDVFDDVTMRVYLAEEPNSTAGDRGGERRVTKCVFPGVVDAATGRALIKIQVVVQEE